MSSINVLMLLDICFFTGNLLSTVINYFFFFAHLPNLHRTYKVTKLQLHLEGLSTVIFIQFYHYHINHKPHYYCCCSYYLVIDNNGPDLQRGKGVLPHLQRRESVSNMQQHSQPRMKRNLLLFASFFLINSFCAKGEYEK